MLYTHSDIELIQYQQEDEVCGSCFNPAKNFDCGTCAPGLECVEDPQANLLPDLPSKCKRKPSNTPFIIMYNFRNIAHKFRILANSKLRLDAEGVTN